MTIAMTRALRQVRGWFRLARLGLHLVTCIVTVAVVYPLVQQPVRLWLRQRWSRQLVGMLGVRFDIAGQPPNLRGLSVHGISGRGLSLRGLIVANHISWLDIYVIHALSPAAFVCKSDVRDWPVIGWLCARTDCVFIERGKRSAAMHTSRALKEKLASGTLAAVFPEGTTSDGSTLLRFHGALLQAAIDAQVPVQAICLGYYDASDNRSDAAAYCGDTTLLQSMRKMAYASGLTVRTHILPPLPSGEKTRQELTRQARTSIEDALLRGGLPVLHGQPKNEDAADPAFLVSIS